MVFFSGRTLLLLRCVCFFFLVSLFESRPLWSDIRDVARAPLLGISCHALEDFLYVALVSLLVLCAALPSRLVCWLCVLCAVLLAVQDASRLQPWLVQFALLLVSLASSSAPLRDTRLVHAAIYWWSGFHKLNHEFLHKLFPYLVRPLHLEAIAQQWPVLGLSAAVGELALGVMLLMLPQLWRLTCAGVVGMHAFILVSLSPLGHNWNRIVWPWNVAMITLLFVAGPETAEERATKRRSLGSVVVVVVALVLPALYFVGLYPAYASFSMYGGDTKAAVILADHNATIDKLRFSLRQFWIPPSENEFPGTHKNLVMHLSYYPMIFLGVPFCPERSVYLAVFGDICQSCNHADDLLLRIHVQHHWVSTFREDSIELYGCNQSFPLVGKCSNWFITWLEILVYPGAWNALHFTR